MVTHLRSDILEYGVKWVLGSFATSKANGGDGIPAELLQILKGNAIKVLYSIWGQIWKTQQWPHRTGEDQVFIPIPQKDNAKEGSTTTQLHSFHIC